MVQRWVVAGVMALALVASGCSKPTVVTVTHSSSPSASTSSSPTSSASATTEADAPQATLEPQDCVDVTQANLDLATANNAADAQKAADVFARFSPPPPVQEAIDHFVETGGPQVFDDDKYQEYNDRIDEWVKQVCPL
jgi:hypothetical protein